MILKHRTDIDWLRLACQTAAEHSDDPHTQNGAVLVPQDGFVAAAANCLPRGIRHSQERLNRPEKYRWIEHAERGAIYAAARQGTKTDGAVLYCPWWACTDCARAIIEAGIVEVVGLVATRQMTPKRWEQEIAVAEGMLREARVGMRWLNERVGVTIFFDGKELEL